MFSTFLFSDLCPAAQPSGQCTLLIISKPEFFPTMNISYSEYFPPLNISHPLMFSVPPLDISHPWIYPTMNVSHILIFLTPEYFSPQNISHLRIFLTSEYFLPQNISHLNISHPILPLQPLLPLPGFTHDWILTFWKCYRTDVMIFLSWSRCQQ